jgi:hypothetical protein
MFKFNYRDKDYVEPDSLEWHSVHVFGKGFGWEYYRNNVRYTLFIDKKQFDSLNDEERLELAIKLDEEEKERNASIPPIELSKIHIPQIRKAFPPLSIDDLVGIQPFTKDLKQENNEQ